MFTQLVDGVNRKRIERILAGWSEVKKFLPALAAVNQECNLEEFLPAKQLEGRRTIEQVTNETFTLAKERGYRHLKELGATPALKAAIDPLWSKPDFLGKEIGDIGDAETLSMIEIESRIAKLSDRHRVLIDQMRREQLVNGPLNLMVLANIINYQTVTFSEVARIRWLLDPFANELRLNEWSTSRGLKYFVFGDVAVLPLVVSDLGRRLSVKIPDGCDALKEASLANFR